MLVVRTSQLSVFLYNYLENLFIKATKLKKLDNANKIEYARKKLKLDQKVDKADINNTMINFKIFEPEIFVLRSNIHAK